MIASTPLFARIQSLVDEVVRLLREEVQQHPSEKWDEVCQRVSGKAKVIVSLARYLNEVYLPRYPDEKQLQPHGNTHLDQALNECYVVVQRPRKWELWFKLRDWVCAPEHVTNHSQAADIPEGSERPNVVPPIEPSTEGQLPLPMSVSPPIRSTPPGVSRPPIYNEAYLVREFDRRECEHGPIFAGFIVNDLLPRMGFDAAEAKRILRAMEAQDMVRTERKPNPKQPGRTTTFVTLNRNHPHVARVLQGAAAIQRTFPIGSVEGESLSETIIRERR